MASPDFAYLFILYFVSYFYYGAILFTPCLSVWRVDITEMPLSYKLKVKSVSNDIRTSCLSFITVDMYSPVCQEDQALLPLRMDQGDPTAEQLQQLLSLPPDSIELCSSMRHL